MSIDRVSGPPASNVAMTPTAARPTPTPERVGASFGAILAKGASAAVSILPGGSQLAAAVRSGPSPMSGAAPGTVGGGLGGTNLTPQGPTLNPGGGAAGGGVSAGGVTVGTGGAGSTGLISTGDPVADMQATQMQLINLQVSIQSASQTYAAESNVLNAEHQAAMGAIQNIRA